MKKWGMVLGILLLAAGLCRAAEPAATTDMASEQGTVAGKAPDQATPEQKAPEQKAPEQKAPEQKGADQKAPDQAAQAPAGVDMDKASYSLGVLFGRDMKSQGLELKVDAFMKGFKTSLSDGKPEMTDEEMQQVMTALSADLAVKKQTQLKKAMEENKAKEDSFLSENKKKEGVQVLPSGLQYKVLKEGAGKKPTADDSVTVNYRGTLLDGKEFDSSYKRNEPATLPVSGVIPGWTEALQLMKAGSKWEIYIPAKLAYGEAGVGEVIPPNSTLIFQVELLSVKQAPKKAAAPAKKQAKKPVAKPSAQGAQSGN